MTRGDFDSMLRRNPMLAYDMARVLSMLLRQSNEATIRDLRAKNEELEAAYRALQEAQAHIIEKDRLEHGLQLAREIQESILPRHVPRLHGFDLGVRLEPAQAVGGDFFDFVPLDDERMAVVAGNVSGKGMPAAIFMAMTRSLLRAEAQRASTARDALAWTNELLLEMNDAAMFATVLYGILQRHTREFVLRACCSRNASGARRRWACREHCSGRRTASRHPA
jgi:sigma-B regulation protein RsbU (phosphoserine phosphatase)